MEILNLKKNLLQIAVENYFIIQVYVSNDRTAEVFIDKSKFRRFGLFHITDYDNMWTYRNTIWVKIIITERDEMDVV